MTRTDTPAPAAESRAESRAKIREGFIWHLGTYLIMMAFFVAIAAMAGTGTTWVSWVAIPWGLALAFHALATLVNGTRLGRGNDHARET